jgi:hypothetical protein
LTVCVRRRERDQVLRRERSDAAGRGEREHDAEGAAGEREHAGLDGDEPHQSAPAEADGLERRVLAAAITGRRVDGERDHHHGDDGAMVTIASSGPENAPTTRSRSFVASVSRGYAETPGTARSMRRVSVAASTPRFGVTRKNVAVRGRSVSAFAVARVVNSNGLMKPLVPRD